MRKMLLCMAAVVALSTVVLHAQQTSPNVPAKAADTSPHTVRFVTVAPDVKLEVLDWGGKGRPLILLAGLGFTAHVYDAFAPKLAQTYHVYGVTRRGFGASSAPKPDCGNYSADRLGDDVLAVMAALKIDRPVLVGHSIAGEELSSIGSRYPEKVAGLIYLDAGYGYAYYNASATEGDPAVDSNEMLKELDRLYSPIAPREQKALVQHLLGFSLPRVENDLQEAQKQLQDIPDTAPAPHVAPEMQQTAVAIERGEDIYTGVKCPVLAIFADPHNFEQIAGMDPAKRAALVANDRVRTSAQADAFQAGNPQARVVRLPNASHFVFRSNEADVLREMNAFINSLPDAPGSRS